MVHCDHLGGGWTDCTAVGNMATCQTMGTERQDQAQGDSGAALGEGLGSLIASMRERSFRKKVGSLLAAGDCENAARYAFEKGRLELGYEIKRNCQSYGATGTQLGASPAALESTLSAVAEKAKVPVDFDANSTITQVSAQGRQLTLSISIRDKERFTDEWRRTVTHDICDAKGFGQFLGRGATVRVAFNAIDGKQLGTLTIDNAMCQ